MERIRLSFERQGLMRTLGASLVSVESGTVAIACAFDNATRTRVLAKMTATMMSVEAKPA